MTVEKSFIVYTGAGGLYREGSYTSAGRARAAMRKATKYDGSPKYPEPDYEVMTVTEFNKRDVMVTTHNLMNGKAVQIRLSDKGSCCDPGTERYFTM